jgi:hypothetical protein
MNKEIAEEEKLELVKARFENIDEDDLIDGQEFFDGLDSGKDSED